MRAPSIDHLKNGVWAVLLGVVAIVVVMSTGSARASKTAVPEGDEPLDPSQLVPVPVGADGRLPPGPTKAPLPFVLAGGEDRGPRLVLSSSEERAVVERARKEMELVSTYDATWMETSSYPMGDVPSSRGACTDVVVRSLREIGIDLQQLVHEDILRDARPYKLESTDIHIDHRRVSTMFTFFQRHAMSLPLDHRQKDTFRPGDIVFVAWQWMRGAPPEHVGIVSDKIGPRGYPLLIENGGPRPVEADSLGKGKIVGHFRALQKRDR